MNSDSLTHIPGISKWWQWLYRPKVFTTRACEVWAKAADSPSMVLCAVWSHERWIYRDNTHSPKKGSHATTRTPSLKSMKGICWAHVLCYSGVINYKFTTDHPKDYVYLGVCVCVCVLKREEAKQGLADNNETNTTTMWCTAIASPLNNGQQANRGLFIICWSSWNMMYIGHTRQQDCTGWISLNELLPSTVQVTMNWTWRSTTK